MNSNPDSSRPHRARPGAATLLACALAPFASITASAQTEPAVEFSAPSPVNWVGAATSFADLDGDGDIDTLASYSGDQLSVALQSDTGTFSLTRFGPYRHGVLADVNGDGALDIVAIYRFDGVEIYTNDGAGHFTPTASVPKADFPSPREMFLCAAADVDNDGDVDIVVGGDRWNNHFSLLVNDGTGHFTVVWDSPVLPSSEGRVLKFADFNHDGFVDFIDGGDIRGPNVWINNRDHTFTGAYAINGAAQSWTEGLSQFAIETTDINGDGRLDFVCAEASGSGDWSVIPSVRWYENTGDMNNFIPHVGYAAYGLATLDGTVVPWWNHMALGDLDHDGDQDIVISAGIPQVLLNDGQGNFTKGWELTEPFNGIPEANFRISEWVYLSDTDLDGNLELLGYGFHGGHTSGNNLRAPALTPEQVIDQLLAEIDDLDADLANANAQIQSLSSQLAGSTAQLDALTVRVTACAADKASLQAQLDASAADVATLQATLATAQADLAAQMDACALEKAALTAQLATANTSIEKLNLQLTALNTSYIALKTAHKDTLAELSAANSKIAELNQTVANQNASYAKLKATLSAELATLQSALDAANTAIEARDSTITDQAATIASQSNTIATQQATITRHESTLADQASVIAAQSVALASLHDTIDSLSEDAAAVATAITALEAGLGDHVAPGFTIPGATADEKLAHLAEALADLEKGQRQQLVRDLAGKKPHAPGKSGQKSAKDDRKSAQGKNR